MAPVPVEQAAAVPETVEERFRRLAAAWEEAVSPHSSSSVRNHHPAYQEIIRMGPEVVPLLLRDLAENGRHWFWALKVITGANPVPSADRGKIDKVTAAWLRWGHEHGYQW